MGKVISMRLSDAEEARVRSAAALTGLSTSAYLKRLLINGKNGDHNDNDEIILRRLDEIGVAVARLTSVASTPAVKSTSEPYGRAAVVHGLKDRGVPSSTIRQVEAVLDELEKRR